jgi:hypothetical protein
MTDHNLVSIDLAKTVFQVCRFADSNKVLSNKKISRNKLSQEIAQLTLLLLPWRLVTLPTTGEGPLSSTGIL